MNRREFSAACLSGGAIAGLPTMMPEEFPESSALRRTPEEIRRRKDEACEDVFVALAAGFAHELLKQRADTKRMLVSCSNVPRDELASEPCNVERCAKDACQMASIILEAARKS